ncbi:MAG: glycosyltransferase family 2 protein [Cyclobacteriaceae bacterium]|nr:glycosyltransferase family 2 protein [Cyclobacteriaceae bacterium HetDA_MAG_MS6]
MIIKNLVSVIIPTFNSKPELLTKTIQSVLDQTYSEIEVIVVDDYSKDPFSGVDKHLNESNITWLKSDQNNGVAKARNIGIEKSKGEYIAFLDSYDWWEPTKLQNQLDLLTKKDVSYGLVYSSTCIHYPDKTIRAHAKVEGEVHRDLMVTQPLTGSASSVLSRKSCIDEVGMFYDELDIPEDREFWLRLCLKYKVLRDESFNVHLLVLPGSRSADPKKKAITYLRFLEMYEDQVRKEKLWNKALSGYYYELAFKYKKIDKPVLFLVNLIRSFLLDRTFLLKDIKNKLYH